MGFAKRLQAGYAAFKGYRESEDYEKSWMPLLEWLGIDTNNKSAMSEATYFTCLKILGEAVGKIPIKFFRRTEQEGAIEDYNHPLHHVLNVRPNPYMAPSVFWAMTENCRNHWGNAYSYIHGAGEKLSLWPLPNEKVQVWIDDKDIWEHGENAVWYLYSSPKGMVKFSNEEVLHFKTSSTFGGILGLSVREQLKRTIEGNLASQEVVNKLYESGLSKKAVLKHTSGLNDESARTFAEGIEAYIKGKAKGLENVIPIPIGSDLTTLDMNLTDAQFLEIKQYSAGQIAAAFGIKPFQLGNYKELSYKGAESQNLSFYVDTLLYILKQYEEELTYKLVTSSDIEKGYSPKFNVGVILRADQKTQVETLTKGVGTFVYTPNEARRLLDLPTKEGGDQLLGNGASIPLTLIGTQYQKSGQGGGGE